VSKLSLTRNRRRFPGFAGLVLFCALVPAHQAVAGNLLGLYLGGAVGQSQLDVGIPTVVAPFSTYNFKENHSGYEFMVGVRPISLLGAELEYLDFGHPSSSAGTMTNDVSIKGSGAFALLYLPIPIVDVFVKAGLAKLETSSTSYDPQVNCGVAPNPNCPYASWHDTTTDFAAGAGIQFKFLSWAVRGEYQQFRVPGGSPKFLSIGVTYTF
jgi:opacity protein-like surface antigen